MIIGDRVTGVDEVGFGTVEDVNPATLAIWTTSIPWAESSTIWARSQRTTEPEERRPIWSRRRPSSLLISRTRIFSRT